MLQRLPFKQFHGDEWASFEFSDVVDGADVGMVQRRGGARLAAESLDRLRVWGNIFRKEFESDVAAEADVLGPIDNAHASAAKLFDDGVMRNGATND